MLISALFLGLQHCALPLLFEAMSEASAQPSSLEARVRRSPLRREHYFAATAFTFLTVRAIIFSRTFRSTSASERR